VGYELFLFPVPGGADVEETGEALLVRLTRGHERTRLTEAGRAAAERLARNLVAVDPELSAAPAGVEALPGAVELRAASGLVVAITDRFARFLVPFAHEGEAAVAAFRQLFTLLAVVADATGWRPYDPQEGEAVALDDATRDSVLEIYLSVMDQLRPGPGAPGGA
jgi:phage terminase large subunit-like protein